MNIEEKVKQNLLTRGFSNGTMLNNRGLIGATIDETILELFKNLHKTEVSGNEAIPLSENKKDGEVAVCECKNSIVSEHTDYCANCGCPFEKQI